MEKKQSNSILILLIIVVALSLRAPIGNVGPIMQDLREALGISGFFAGFLTSIPLVGFALAAVFAGVIVCRFENWKTLFYCLVLMTAGILLRSCGTVFGLYAGTIVLGLGLGVLNVALPALIRFLFPERIEVITGIFTCSMTLTSAIAAGISKDVLNASGNWQIALGFPVIVIVLGVLCVLVFKNRLNTKLPPVPVDREKKKIMNFDRVMIGTFQGFQAVIFFAMITWLPSICAQRNQIGEAAGKLTLVLQCVSGCAGIVATNIAKKTGKKRLLSVLCSSLFTVGLLCIFFGGNNVLPVMIGAGFLGAACGSTLSLSLVFLTHQGRNAGETARISSFCQTLTHVEAAVSPTLFGLIHDLTGGWDVVMCILIGVAVCLMIVGYFAGRAEEKRIAGLAWEGKV